MKRKQVEIKMKLKNPITQLENLRERLAINQVKDRILELEDKVKQTTQIIWKIIKSIEKKQAGTLGHQEKTKITDIDKGKES